MEPQQATFDTFSTWMLTRLLADLAPCDDPSAAPLHPFFSGLYQDILVNPDAYFIPHEPFETFTARDTHTPEEKAQHEKLKAARMRVRKAVYAYVEFLFSLGKAGTPRGADLQLPRSEFEKLTTAAIKKAKIRHFPGALEHTGFSFSSGDPMIVANSTYPGMPAALAAFAQACERVKDFDFYLFRRCDQAVFAGKKEPDFSDALRLVPDPYKREVAEIDEKLMQMAFKREIFIDGGDMTYRVRYSKKGDLIVYWVRIQETFQPDLTHYLRWDLESELTAHLFSRLDQTHPGLADQVFMGLKPCAHCYENCQDRCHVERNGVTREVCKGSGWNQIGYTASDYEKLWTVIEAFA